MDVNLRGADEYEETIPVDAGSFTTVKVPQPGLLHVRVDGRRTAVIAEPYTAVTIDLQTL